MIILLSGWSGGEALQRTPRADFREGLSTVQGPWPYSKLGMIVLAVPALYCCAMCKPLLVIEMYAFRAACHWPCSSDRPTHGSQFISTHAGDGEGGFAATPVISGNGTLALSARNRIRCSTLGDLTGDGCARVPTHIASRCRLSRTVSCQLTLTLSR